MNTITVQRQHQNFTAQQLAQAKVPLQLALWHVTIGRRLRRTNILDELRLETVQSMVKSNTS